MGKVCRKRREVTSISRSRHAPLQNGKFEHYIAVGRGDISYTRHTWPSCKASSSSSGISISYLFSNKPEYILYSYPSSRHAWELGCVARGALVVNPYNAVSNDTGGNYPRPFTGYVTSIVNLNLFKKKIIALKAYKK
jgi:hypothetical protein